ncbi:hypothetical protein ACFX4N_24395 [Priestia sp. YIM B13551]|uniref:hypothetical protein n=1 Tax=Priestia sp. YIM B13551 TaxID=3366306 RepID=UPI00366BCA48
MSFPFHFIEQKTMSVEKTKPGDKLVCKYPDNGMRSDGIQAKKYLQLDKEYTVEHIQVYGSRTEVALKEFPGELFNSVHFMNKEDVEFGFNYAVQEYLVKIDLSSNVNLDVHIYHEDKPELTNKEIIEEALGYVKNLKIDVSEKDVYKIFPKRKQV